MGQSASQLALKATNDIPMYEEAAARRKRATQFVKGRRPPTQRVFFGESGEAAQLVAAAHGVSARSVRRAQFLRRNGVQELVNAVRDGRVSLHVAQELSRRSADAQVAALADLALGPMCFIYAVKLGERLVKVGRSNCPEFRLQQYRVGAPDAVLVASWRVPSHRAERIVLSELTRRGWTPRGETFNVDSIEEFVDVIAQTIRDVLKAAGAKASG